MSRIQEIPPEKLTAEQKKILDDVQRGRGRVPAPFKIWLHSPALATRIESLGTYLVTQSSLSAKEVELATVVLARHWRANYVLTAHIKMGREAGIPDAVLEAIKNDATPTLTDPRDKAVYEIARGFDQRVNASDELFERAVKVLGRNGVAELIALLGYYTAVGMAMKLHQVPIPGGGEP